MRIARPKTKEQSATLEAPIWSIPIRANMVYWNT